MVNRSGSTTNSISSDRLAAFFKTLGDENRLKLLSLLNNQERNVGEIAGLLELSEPTVSHHLSKLREMGLVNLRQAGNQRFYTLNIQALNRWKQHVMEMEHLPFDHEQSGSSDAWIDELDLDEHDRKVLRDYTANHRLKHIPVKQKKLMAVLRWLATVFEADVLYSEQQVNQIIGQYHEDFARLRRELIESGFLRRERNGKTYWKA